MRRAAYRNEMRTTTPRAVSSGLSPAPTCSSSSGSSQSQSFRRWGGRAGCHSHGQPIWVYTQRCCVQVRQGGSQERFREAYQPSSIKSQSSLCDITAKIRLFPASSSGSASLGLGMRVASRTALTSSVDLKSSRMSAKALLITSRRWWAEANRK